MDCVLRQYTNANAIKITTERMFQLKLETMSNDNRRNCCTRNKTKCATTTTNTENKVMIEMGGVSLEFRKIPKKNFLNFVEQKKTGEILGISVGTQKLATLNMNVFVMC